VIYYVEYITNRVINIGNLVRHGSIHHRLII